MSPIRLKRPGSPEPLSETAADWVLRSERGTLTGTDEQQLREWLDVPAHAQAYDDALWALDSVQRHSGSAELMAMRQAALARKPEPAYSHGWAAGIAAMAALLIGLFLWTGMTPQMTPVPQRGSPVSERQVASASQSDGVYRTGIGERSAVVLPDGSVATLDTDSQLRVAYNGNERGIYLIRGQALFEVAKGRKRPFNVYAAGQRITALGTTFNVRVKDGRVEVAMVEGVVKVRPDVQARGGAPVQELTLRAGDSLVAAAAQPAIISSVDASQIAAWRGGLLVFEDEKLSDAIAEVNRYTDKPIRLADASLGEYRVTGVFKTNDAAHFAKAMSEVFPIAVEQQSDGKQLLKPQR